MKSIFVVAAILLSATLVAEEISETIVDVSKSVDSAPRDRFLTELNTQRTQMTTAVVAILAAEGSTTFQKAFALELVTRNRLTDALDATLPYVAFVNPLPVDNMSMSGVYLGARALVSIGYPANERLLAAITGKEDDQTINGLAVVIAGIDGREFGKIKVDTLAKAAAKDKKTDVQKTLNKVFMALNKQ